MFLPQGKNMGVYQILNTVNSKKYIGSTCDLRRRKRQHVYRLRHNKHYNLELQKDFDEYGENVFAFLVLELVDDRKLLKDKEQEHLDSIKPEYNVSTKAKSSDAHLVLNKHSQKKRSKTVKQLWVDGHYDHLKGAERVFKAGHAPNLGREFSKEWRENISKSMMGEKNPNYGKPKSKKFMEALSKTYSGAISPEGKVYTPIINMNKFCKEHNLDNGSMTRLMQGKQKSSKGWVKFEG